jgi:hypothetical protein
MIESWKRQKDKIPLTGRTEERGQQSYGQNPKKGDAARPPG